MAGATEARIALVTQASRVTVLKDQAVLDVNAAARSIERKGFHQTEAHAAAVNAAVFPMQKDVRACLQRIRIEEDLDIDFDGAPPRISGADIRGLDPARTYRVLAVVSSNGFETELEIWG